MPAFYGAPSSFKPCALSRCRQLHRCARQASGIPAFYVAFCVTPFASNASELVSSLMFARRKRRKNISLTFSQARCSLHLVWKHGVSEGLSPLKCKASGLARFVITPK